MPLKRPTNKRSVTASTCAAARTSWRSAASPKPRSCADSIPKGESPGGIVAAVLTPFDRELRPDPRVAIPYYRELLERGCDGLNVMGTTGEAMSIGLSARAAFIEAVASGLPRERVMTGTSAAALDDAVVLTKTAFECGLRALVIPPFYYRDASDNGILRFFATLFDRTHAKTGSVILYNFPRMSGIELHAGLIGRLAAEFPDVIAGLKDSSNDLELERTVHERLPALAVFCGSEEFLPQIHDAGLAGCISGSVCLWPERATAAWRSGDAAKLREVAELRRGLNAPPFIPRVRERVAAERSDPSWLRSLPPLDPVSSR